MATLLSNQKLQSEAEPIVYQAKVHPIVNIIPIIMMIIGSAGVFLLFISLINGFLGLTGIIGLPLSFLFFKGLSWFIRNRRIKVYLTERHLNFEGGVLGRETSRISLKKIESIALTQSMLGKLLNFGTLSIHTAGTNQWIKIKDPGSFQKYLLTLGQD